MLKELQFTTQKGNQLSIDYYKPEPDNVPLILYCHGFKGFKNWGFVPYTGMYCARNGLRFVAFNFSHNGIGKDKLNFTELEKFSENTYSLELEECLEMVDAITSGKLDIGHVPDEIGILGHSRGGGIALLAGCRNERVSAVTTWAAVSDFDRLSDKERKEWREKGYREIVNSRTGQTFRMNLSILNDYEKNKEDKLNILKAVEESHTPVCVIHGTDDEAVPPIHGRKIAHQADFSYAEMHLHEGTGHTFGAKHPWEGSNPVLENVLEQTVSFFKRNLK